MPEFDVLLPEIYVQPGESHLVTQPTILRTVLGSCVGITFWHGRLGIAALCHPMLPCAPDNPPATLGFTGEQRYVNIAVRGLAQQFDALGACRSDVHVKVFGGGDVLNVYDESSRPTIGRLNCEMALNVLREEGFRVIASSLRDTCGLNIQFHTGTGEVLLRRLV